MVAMWRPIKTLQWVVMPHICLDAWASRVRAGETTIANKNNNESGPTRIRYIQMLYRRSDIAWGRKRAPPVHPDASVLLLHGPVCKLCQEIATNKFQVPLFWGGILV